MVVHADEVKKVVDQRYDHKLILDADDPMFRWLTSMPAWSNFRVRDDMFAVVEGPPTTENLAFIISKDVADAVRKSNPYAYVGLVRVTLKETPTIWAEAVYRW